MSENPYESPHSFEPADEKPLAPAWRRFISLPLLILGGLGLIGGLVGFSIELFHRHQIQDEWQRTIFAMLIYSCMVGAGILLRCRWRL